ncbi:MAG: glycosyltransferase [Terriglobia bacterium]
MSNQLQPGVSVIIPARNEELNIEAVVRSLAPQSEICEIIVVDDQSQDHTAEILAGLAREFVTLRVLRLGSLPSGWLGKPHAAAEGAKLAEGEWLLFTDADTRHKPGSLASLLKRAESSGAAMLSISPGQRMETWWEKSVIPLVYLQLAVLFRFEEVNDPQFAAAAANGQYILIRRSIYDAVGGFEAVRGEILEDVELAKRVKSTGATLLFLPGAGWVETRMYRTFGEMWRGWTKNLFLLYGRDSGKIQSTILRLLVVQCLPGVLLAALTALILSGHHHPWAYAAWAVCLIAFCLQQRAGRRQLGQRGFSPGLSPYVLAGAPLLSLIMLNSLRAYRRGGSIQWKGRTYPTKGER